VIGVAYAYILQFNDFCQSSSACIADKVCTELRAASYEPRVDRSQAFGVFSRLATRNSQLNMDGEDQKDLSQPNMRFQGAPTQVCIKTSR